MPTLFLFSREKKREREREELWKRLHDLEITKTNNQSDKSGEIPQQSSLTQENNVALAPSSFAMGTSPSLGNSSNNFTSK